MVQAREQLRLALEPLPPLFTFEELLREDLHRDVAPEARIPAR